MKIGLDVIKKSNSLKYQELLFILSTDIENWDELSDGPPDLIGLLEPEPEVDPWPPEPADELDITASIAASRDITSRISAFNPIT